MARIFLAMNGKRINTLDDLRANFNGKQMLDFYRAGRLQKWLEELGEHDLLETLQDFQKENYDDETLLSMLMAAFELDADTIAKQTASLTAAAKKQEDDTPVIPPSLDESEKEEEDMEEFSDVCPQCKGRQASYPLPKVAGARRKCPACNGTGKNAMAAFLNGRIFRNARKKFSGFSKKEQNFLALATLVKETIREAVSNSEDLSSGQRNRNCDWSDDFEDFYGYDAVDLGINEAVKNAFGVDDLRYSYTPKDILESLIAQSFPEMLDGGELRSRYEELL